MAYTLSLRQPDMTCRSVPSAEIIAALDPAVPLQLAHIRRVEQLERDGCRYSYEDFDVLSAAYRAIGKTEIAPHVARWVEAMTAQS